MSTRSAVALADVIFATAAAAPFRRTNYVGMGMVNTSKYADTSVKHMLSSGQEILEEGWSDVIVLSPSQGLGHDVKQGSARFHRFDLVHKSTAEFSRAFEAMTGLSVSCAVSALGSPLGFPDLVSAVFLAGEGAYACHRTDKIQSRTRTKALNVHDSAIFLEAGSKWMCSSDSSEWEQPQQSGAMLLNCAFQGPGKGSQGQPLPYSTFAPRTFSPSLFPCVSFRQLADNQLVLTKRCSVAGLGSGSSSFDWKKSLEDPAEETRKRVNSTLETLVHTRQTIGGLVASTGQRPVVWALEAAYSFLSFRTAASQKSGEVANNMDDPTWWKGWPTGGFPNRTFVGPLKSGPAAGSVGAHNTFHFMHLNTLVSASTTRLFRRGDIPAIICMEGHGSEVQAAPASLQVYDADLDQGDMSLQEAHTPLSLCLYRSDPMRFKSPLVLFTAQAMLSFPPGVAFTPVEACLLAIQNHSHEKLSAYGSQTAAEQLTECRSMHAELEALTRILVVAEGVVFFDERHASDASTIF